MTDRKKLLIHSASLVFFIFLINLVAFKFYWYYSIWYFDMIMHFLGGFWLGLSFFWIFSTENLSFKLFFKIVLGVLIIGVLWEVFEVFVNHFLAQNPFNLLDTASDICFDLAGGVFAIIFYIKKIMLKQKSTI